MRKGNSSDWFNVKHHLEEALSYGYGLSDLDDVRDGLAGGLFELWVGDNSAIVTQVIDRGRNKALLFYLAGGKLGEVKDMSEKLESLAKDTGCSKVLINGRAGWGKVLTGYKERTRVFEKEL